MSDLTVPPMVMGLRFRKSQARVLRNIAEWARANDLPGVDATLYDKAAESAAAGEPLVVHCENREEVEGMAAGFVLLGVARPEIDELTPVAG